MNGSPKKAALLALRKQIQALIAHEQAEDPEAAAEGHADAAQALGNSGMGASMDAEPEHTPTDVQMKFMDYMKPKVRERRPGTGAVMGAAPSHASHKAPEKKMPPGRPKREAF